MIGLDDANDRLDVALAAEWPAASYWTPGIGRDRVEAQIAGSHCRGAYLDGQPVGFTCAITDDVSFAWIADVWVNETVRGSAPGPRRVQYYLDHPRYPTVRRFALVTGVHEKLGFHALLGRERYMERLSGAFAAQVKALP